MKYDKPWIEILDFVAMERLAIVEEKDKRDSTDLDDSDPEGSVGPRPGT